MSSRGLVRQGMGYRQVVSKGGRAARGGLWLPILVGSDGIKRNQELSKFQSVLSPSLSLSLGVVPQH